MIKKILFTLLFFGVSILYIPLLNFPSLTPKWVLWSLLSPLLFLSIKKREKIPLTTGSILFFIFFLFQMLTILWAKSKISAINSILAVFIVIISYFPVFIYLKTKRDLFTFITHYLTISSLIVSLIGILQYFGFIENLFNQVAAPASLFVNKNFASPYTLFAFWWIFLYLLKTNRMIFIPSIALNLFYIMLSATRSVWTAFLITFFIFIIVIIFTSKIKFRLQPIILIVSFFFGLYFLTFLKPNNVKMHRNFKKQADSLFTINKSAKVRINRWKNSQAIIASKPLLGYGVGNYKVIYPLYHNAKTNDEFYSTKYFFGGAHNEFIQLICESGILGFLLFIILLVWLFSNLKHIEDIYIGYTILLSTLSLLIISFFSSTFHYPTYLFLFMINFIVADIHLKKKVFSLTIPQPVYFFMLLFAIYLSYKIFQSDRNHKIANGYFYRGKINYAWKFSNKAISYWKYDDFLLFNATNYGFTLINFKKTYDKKLIEDFKKINSLTLKAIPFHFLPNYAKGLFLYKLGTDIQIKKYLENRKILLKICPDNRKKELKKLISALEKKI